jgi:hypothetical protein
MRIYREDWYLFFIYLAISILIILNSYFMTNGYLSPDSTNYLSLAQNLINGNGYIISSDRMQPFAVWPIGYPTLIAIVSYLTGLSVFWASKVLNIFLIGLIFLLLRKYYKKDTYLIALLFTWGSYIYLYFYTWSESFFIFSLILFSVSVYEFIKAEKPKIQNYIFIFLSALLLYFSRYIGAFGFGIVGLLGIFFLVLNKNKKGLGLVVLSFLGLIIVVLNLYINYKLTGYPTGMPRIKSPETNLELFYELIKALFYEIIIPFHSGGWKAIFVFIIQVTVFLIGYKLYGLNNADIRLRNMFNDKYLLEIIFIVLGLIYLVIIVLMRWLFQFDTFNFRLLSPATILVYMGVLGVLIKNKIFDNNWLKIYMVVFSFFSLLYISISVLYKAYKKDTYLSHISKMEKEIKFIPLRSTVIFPPKDLKYLRLDLNLYTPYYTPYYKNKETWDSFKSRINCKGGKKIYIYIDKKLDSKHFDKTVIQFYNNLKSKYKTKNNKYIEYICK